MTKYVSTQVWQDLTDMHLYAEGEPFPFDGRDVGEERLNELESGRNRAGLRLIRAVDVQDDEIPAPKEEAPKQAAVARKTAPAKATRKKTTKK